MRTNESCTSLPGFDAEVLAKLQKRDKVLGKVVQYCAGGKKPGKKIVQLMLAQSFKHTILHNFHNSSVHQGMDKTGAVIKERCYWLFMKYRKRHCRECEKCKLAKELCRKMKTKMQHLLSSKPLELVCIYFTILVKKPILVMRMFWC